MTTICERGGVLSMQSIFENEDGQGIVAFGIILAIASIATVGAVIMTETKRM